MISSIAKLRMEYTLKAIEDELILVKESMKEARAFGDLSENSEYTASSAEFTRLTMEKARLEETLQSETVISEYGNVIGIGTLISLEILEGNKWADQGLILFDEHGSSIFDGTISRNSNLGRALEGRTSGEYTYQDSRGIETKCRVKIEPESRLSEYTAKYPPDRKLALAKIFSLEDSK